MIYCKKGLALFIAVIICFGVVPAIAAPVDNDDNIVLDITHDFSGMTKQEAAAYIYDSVIAFDESFAISEKEAELILNDCYDNGKLKVENRVPFAFCVSHGIIKKDNDMIEEHVLTDQQAEAIVLRTENCFEKDKTFLMKGKDIKINSNVSELISTFGNPARIDKTIYGFEWYVYNSNESGFFMAGVRGKRVCAFFSNDDGYDVFGYHKGMDNTVAIAEGVTVYEDENGNVDGILYNPNSVETKRYSDEILISLENELLDIINTHRSDTAKLTLNRIDTVNAICDFSESAGQNVFELFYGMIMQKAENPDIINETVSTSADVAIDVAVTTDGGLRAAVATNANVFGILPDTKTEVVEGLDIEEIEKPFLVSAPEIVSISSGDVLVQGEDVRIELKREVSDKYFVKIFDVEKQKDIVCQYVTSDDSVFIYPRELFVQGADYIIEMCAVGGDKLYYAESVEFTYGEAANPVYIEAPFDNSYTYDGEIEVFLSSSVYNDFRLEVINEFDETIISFVICSSKKAVLDNIPSGKYTLRATALKKNSDAMRGQYSVNFEVKKINAVVKEYILNPDERFDFVYESGDYLYFYDEDIVYIDETITEEVTDRVTGETKFVTNTVRSPRKRIIQKKVPATKQYRKLRALYKSGGYTTGAIPSANATKEGNAVANKALLYQGIPYVWGGEDPSGFDCSGLVKYVCNKLGISVHRTSAEQFKYDGYFVNKSQLIPGDLIFFQDNGVIHHVGIYIGDGKMVHAPHTGDVVKVSSINSDYYMREYAGAKRVF